jgi:hypothetical protein
MKTNLKTCVFITFVAILISGCGGSGGGLSSVNNDFLNNLPSIAKDYEAKVEAKEEAIHKNTSIEDAFKLEKELDLLKEEWAAKIKETAAAKPITKPLPFDALADMPYTVNQVTVKTANKSNLSLEFDITVNQDIKSKYGSFEKNLFIYFTAVDKQGNEIPKTTSVAVNYDRGEMKAGLNLKASGQLGPLANLENFAKLKLISKEAYDENQKKKQ